MDERAGWRGQVSLAVEEEYVLLLFLSDHLLRIDFAYSDTYIHTHSLSLSVCLVSSLIVCVAPCLYRAVLYTHVGEGNAANDMVDTSATNIFAVLQCVGASAF